MNVSIMFFGAIADAVGSRELVFPAKGPLTTKVLIDELSQLHPALAKHKLLIAVNETYAEPDTILNNGDSVAIFTAVSGG